MGASSFVLAFIDARPFTLAFGLLALGAAAAGYRVFAGRWPPAHYAYATTIVFLAAFFFFLYGPFIGYTRSVTHPMRWRIDPRGHADTGAAHVVLTFRDYPASYVGIYSNELADYLRTLPEETVPVKFDVIYDYGFVRGLSERQIGDLKAWQSDFAYFGTTGRPGRSPF